MAYIYGILFSPTYHATYRAALLQDFPRIPITLSSPLFQRMALLGEELIEAHLEHQIPSRGFGTFQGEGSALVQKVRFIEDRLYINDTQYFENVSSEVFNFNINTYQLVTRYLKARRGRILSSEEIQHVTNLIKILDFTLEKQKEIDSIYCEIEASIPVL